VILQHLHDLRSYELGQALPLIPKESRILEIGAGTGWQAKALEEKGFSVVAVDVPGTQYADDRVRPVIDYDGLNLPFRRDCFDVVFSSHVLEHIAHVERFQAEIKRVLKPDGTAIHVLPSGSWRFWTNLCLYGYIAKKLAENFHTLLSSPAPVKSNAWSADIPLRRAVQVRALLPSRHGEVGNALSELYLFSRFRWTRLFRRSGWIVQVYRPLRLFYTGHMLLHSRLSLRGRRKLGFVLGSSSHLFCLRRADASL
jgi:2-polyprenyl-3-methyl-5-hydroxy-6-metoxy-1,4-benzoquinol methylase